MLVQAAIAAATTLEEVERLNRLLQTGQVPGREVNGTVQRTGKPHRPIVTSVILVCMMICDNQ